MKSLLRLRPVLDSGVLSKPFALTFQSGRPCLDRHRLSARGPCYDKNYATPTGTSKYVSKQFLRALKGYVSPNFDVPNKSAANLDAFFNPLPSNA